MPLPKQVQQYQDDLDAYEAQLEAQQSGSDEPPKEGSHASDSPSEQDAPAVESTEDEARNQAEPQPAPEPKSEPEPSVSEDKWEHKYRRLQGKYDAEVPRLYSELKELKATLMQMQQAPPKQEPKAEKPPEPKKLITDQDVEAFGDDLIDVARRVAREEMSAKLQVELEKMHRENEALKSQMTAVQGNTFEARLRQTIPDFDEINNDARWVEWLNEVDPLEGEPRRVRAEFWYGNGDIGRVKAYVDAFKQTVAPASDPSKKARQSELKRQVQPTKATNTGATQSGHHPKTYTAFEANAAWRQVQRLNAEGRFDEAKALEDEISLAYMEDRVRA